MGASNSKLEEDKGLQLCRARKKSIKQALDGSCSLAATHITYIHDLRILGAALNRFIQTNVQAESSYHPSAFVERSVSQLSSSSGLPSSPPIQASHQFVSQMKFKSAFSEKAEENPPIHVAVSVVTSTTPGSTHVPELEPSSFETPSIPSETTPWDYFGLFNPIEDHFSSQAGRGFDQSSAHSDEIRQLKEEEGVSVPCLEDGEEKFSSPEIEDSLESEDEFDEPDSSTLVRSFKNISREPENDGTSLDSPAIRPECATPETKLLRLENVNHPKEMLLSENKSENRKKDKSSDISPLRAVNSNDVKIATIKESEVEDKIVPKEFLSSMKDIEMLFLQASESGKEVPRMLEANKFHFRPVSHGKDSGSMGSLMIKSCFSCGNDPSEVQQELPQNSVKYLTWHRTASSRNLLHATSVDDTDDLFKNLFHNFCMVSGSHASTLDRLYAWEKKLHDEVKADWVIRSNFDHKCKLLRQKESRGHEIEKMRSSVKDLHSRLTVSVHRINSISKKIEEIRDKELQPQLEELIAGLKRMWETMLECHSLQIHIAMISHPPVGDAVQRDLSRQITAVQLENGLKSLSSSFAKWISAQKMYVQALNNWLLQCVLLPQNASKRNRRMKPPPLRNLGPPIYMICGAWLEMLDELPSKEVMDSTNDLAAQVASFSPRQEKNSGKAGDHGVKISIDEVSEAAFNRFRTGLTVFLGHVKSFAEKSVTRFSELQISIEESKKKYDQIKSQKSSCLNS